MKLLCHCDHCSNSTCTTHDHGLCWAQLSLNRAGEIVKKLNCFNQESRLVQNLICDDTITKTSQAIVRCCSSGDYCNQKDDFLPPLEEAKRILLQLQATTLSSSSSSLPSSLTFGHNNRLSGNIGNLSSKYLISSSPLGNKTSSTFQQYSDIPLKFKLLFIVVLGLLLVFALALAQVYFSKRRRSIKRVSSHHGRITVGVTAGDTNEEEHSENSSGKVNSDVAVCDNNSMASREPLIQNNINSCNLNHAPTSNNPINLMYHSNSLNHPNPLRGPWMAEELHNGKAHSTFQMSLGSGDPQNKRETSSGSGSGQPYLTQRSIAHDIELVEVVGRGYFGVVWRGEYKGEPVAVKIFSPMAEPSWQREAEIYQTTMLRHKNILGFIATDKRDDISMTGYWLVTDYYPMGSLFDFLKNSSMSMPDAVRMAFSIANGLAHLHVEIFGTQGKPAIAHRDLKSKNILVKNDGTCCIADLGMAVRYNSNTGIVDVPANTRVGTRRYLAPELLDNTLNLMDFEAVKATDVYALGLVLWEILRRTCFVHPSETIDPNFSYSMEQKASPQPSASSAQSTKPSPQLDENYPTTPNKQNTESINRDEMSGYQFTPGSYESSPTNLDESTDTSIDDLNNELAVVCDPYEAPYQQFVSIDPSTEEMREVVCVKKVRPPLSHRWTKFAPMRDYTTLMRECWYGKPQARLSALRIRKTLGDIARHYFNLNMEYD